MSAGWASLKDLPFDLQADPVLAQDALDYANFVLWSLTGRRYSEVQTVTESYDSRRSLSSGSQVYPVLQNGAFYNVSSCSSCTCTGCGVFHRIRLRGSPIQYVVDVWVNGQRLRREDYVILDHSVLGFLNAQVCGAQCVTVQYGYGTGAPPGGRHAAAKLAAEMISARRGEQCRLPERVTSVSRQGMSWTLLDPQDFLKDGRTGIYDIDLLLRAINPSGALLPAKVFSPDLPRASAFTMPDPPMSLLLEGDDQVVVAGAPMRWTSTSPALLVALRNNAFLVTRLSSGAVLAAQWQVLADGTQSTAVLDLSGGETALASSSLGFEVLEASTATVLVSGTVRSFNDAY